MIEALAIGFLAVLLAGGVWISIVGSRIIAASCEAHDRMNRAFLAGSIAGMAGATGDDGPCAVYLREMTKPGDAR